MRSACLVIGLVIKVFLKEAKVVLCLCHQEYQVSKQIHIEHNLSSNNSNGNVYQRFSNGLLSPTRLNAQEMGKTQHTDLMTSGTDDELTPAHFISKPNLALSKPNLDAGLTPVRFLSKPNPALSKPNLGLQIEGEPDEGLQMEEEQSKGKAINKERRTSMAAVVAFVGFLATVALGTYELGLDFKSATMIVTFVATQIALIQPSSLPFLARVGRPWSMLSGACFMILLSDVESDAAFVAIDLNTLALLFGASLISANLEACQIQRNLIEALERDSGHRICIKLCLISAALALVITNDGSSLIVSPVALKLLQKRPELPKLPIMLAVCSSANIGSALFLSGNPQNILVHSFSHDSGLTFTGYMLWALVPTLLSMAINTFLLFFLLKNGSPLLCCCLKAASSTAQPGTGLPLLDSDDAVSMVPPTTSHASLNGTTSAPSSEPANEQEARSMRRYRHMLIACSIAMIAIFFVPQIDVEIGWVTTATALLVTAMYPLFTNGNVAGLLAQVDYELLLMFTGLFVVTGGMTSTGVLDKVWDAVVPSDPFNPENFADQIVFVIFVTVLSNSVGNVPAVLLLQNAMGNSTNPALAWALLAWVSTIAGNLTLLGSAANVIVAAAAQKAGVILSYAGYLKFGFLSTILALTIGLMWTNLHLLFADL
eukprot:g69771.t1